MGCACLLFDSAISPERILIEPMIIPTKELNEGIYQGVGLSLCCHVWICIAANDRDSSDIICTGHIFFSYLFMNG